MNAIIIYWSKGGNTEKVALAIEEGLKEAGADVLVKRVEEAGDSSGGCIFSIYDSELYEL